MLEQTDEPVALSWQECAAQVNARTGILSEVRSSVKVPSPHSERGTNWLVQATPVRPVRCCTDWLYLAALVELRNGRPVEAFTNVQALVSLANLHREEGQLLSQLTRIVVGKGGAYATWDLLASDEMSEQQWAWLQRTWESVDYLSGLERATEGERCFVVEAVHQAVEQRSIRHKGLLWPLYRHTIVDNDLLFGLRHLQSVVECARTFQQGRAWPEVNGRLRELALEVRGKFSGPKRYFYLFTLVAVPDWSGEFSSTLEAETQRRLTVTAIALKRYHLANGQWPKALDLLLPRFLPAVPRDCFNGKPLRYELKADGGLEVSSAAAEVSSPGR